MNRPRDSWAGSISSPEKYGETGQDVQLTLPPPPRHCPHGTIAERFPSAALGRLTCARTVREPGARCVKKRAGCLCAGSLYVGGPASSTRMRKSGSAAARRPATTQPAAPPMERPLCQETVEREGEDGAPPAMMISYSSLIWVGVDIISWRRYGVRETTLG